MARRFLTAVQVDGSVGVGDGTAYRALTVAGLAFSGVSIDVYSNDTSAGLNYFRKARGTIASPSATLTNDYLGYFGFRGHTGSAWVTQDAARLDAISTQDVGATHGGALVFRTAANGTLVSSGPIERMRVDESGNVRIGSSATISAKLTFDASTVASGGVLFGADTNLYRSAANVLKTDDSLLVQALSDPSYMIRATGSNAYASVNGRGLIVDPTYTGAGDGPGGAGVTPIFAPSANISAAYGQITQVYAHPGAGVTISAMYGTYTQVRTGSTGGALTTGTGLVVATPSIGSIVPTTVIGVDIYSQTGASGSSIGMRIQGATTYALQLSSTAGTAASGITFGTDTNLYRSSSNVLQTDDTLNVLGTSLYASGNLTVGDGLSSKNIALRANGYNGVIADIYSDTASAYSYFRRARGTFTTPTAVTNNSILGSFGFRGHDGTTWVPQDSARISAYATQDVTTTHGGAIAFYTAANGTAVGSGSSQRVTIYHDGNVGIGVTVPTYKLQLAASTAAAGGIAFGSDVELYRSAANVLRLNDQFIMRPTPSTGGICTGLDVDNYPTANTTRTLGATVFATAADTAIASGYMAGLEGRSILNHTTTAPLAMGLNFNVENRSSGVLTDARGVMVAVTNYSSGTGSITTAYGVRVSLAGAGAGSATIGTGYGLYIDPQTAVTTPWGVYQAGANDKNYFNGYIGLGVSAAASITSRLRFASDTTVAGGITFGTDVNLYRSGNDLLATDNVLDLSTADGNTPAVGTGIGDKISLHSTKYGFGVQTNRLVAFVDSGAAFAVRHENVGGVSSAGTDGVALFGNGDITAIGKLTLTDAILKREAAGVLAARNSGDSAYGIIRTATPSGADDAVPKNYMDAGVATERRFAFFMS